MNGKGKAATVRKLLTQHNEGIGLSLRRGWAAFKRHRLGVFGLASLAAFTALGILGPEIAESYPQIHPPYWQAPIANPPECNVEHCLTSEGSDPHPEPPTFGDPYWAILGTTARGGDVLGWILVGARVPVFVGLAAGLLSALVSVSTGLVAGVHANAPIDRAIRTTTDVLRGIPSLPLVIVLVVILGPSPVTVVLAVVVKTWLDDAAAIRTEVRRLKTRSHVEAARGSGASDLRVVAHHVLPNVLPLAAVAAGTAAATAVLAQTSVAYLGFLDDDTISWGALLARFSLDGGQAIEAVWWYLPPGLAITLLAASFYFVGYSLEDVMSPSA